jgi:hypothetical protein
LLVVCGRRTLAIGAANLLQAFGKVGFEVL